MFSKFMKFLKLTVTMNIYSGPNIGMRNSICPLVLHHLIFSLFHLRKGDIVTSAEVRQFVMSYIKENNLQSPENPR